MKHLILLRAGLCRRPTRTIFTALSVITAFFLFGTLQGVNAGIRATLNALNVAHLVTMSAVNLGKPLPVAYVGRIASVKGIGYVTGLTSMVGTYRRPNNYVSVLGVDLETFFKIYSDWRVSPKQLASALKTRPAVIVGRDLARKEGWRIGDRIPIHALNVAKSDGTSDWDFEIAGFYDRKPDGWAVNVLANYDYINEGRLTGRNTVDEIFSDIGQPNNAVEIARKVDAMFENSSDETRTENEKEFAQALLRQIGDTSFIINAIVGAVLFTLLFLTANTISQSVRERTPELATLKAIGYTNRAVLLLVIGEALFLTLMGAALGLGLAAMILPHYAQAPLQGIGAMHVSDAVLLGGLAAATALALAGAVPPAERARRLSIVDGLGAA